MESSSVPANVFLVDSADKKSLRDIALEAFAGVNYPIATEPSHDRDNGSGPKKRAFTALHSNNGLHEFAFPHLFFKGVGGPDQNRLRPVTEAELVGHLLRLHHRRFSRDAQFLYFAHSVLQQRRTVMGVTAAMDESDRLKGLRKDLIETLEEPEATRTSKEKSLDQCLDSMTPQMSTVKGSRGF